MIRTALAILLACLVIVVAISLQGDAGAASLTWLGWRVDTTAAAGVLLIGLFALLATLFWRVLVWLLQAPARATRAAVETRRRQGAESLTRGFLAAAAGDGPEARRLAQRAADLNDETPQLVRILAAQAAEAAGDRAAARAAYSAMMGFPEMRLAAHRGLMQTALNDGDKAGALRHARDAYELAHTAPWAWRALLAARLDAGEWAEALTLVNGAQERKIVSPLVAERARAALQTASIATVGSDAASAAAALDLAQAAARSRPDFTPASVVAARLLIAEGRGPRAAPLIEAAWKARPHPALWMAWRDLRTDETPRERAARLLALASLNADTRESRILRAEAALIAGEPPPANLGLESEPATQRLAGLMARVANARGDIDEARAWIARGAPAPGEPDWSDMDTAGRAFSYDANDWARVITAYAETGELIHPRHERGDPVIADLPHIPAAYSDSAAFIRAAEAGGPLPPIVDDGDFGDALRPAQGAPPPVGGWNFLAQGGRKAR
jgi:HemY protein